jgi:hypothetical protein
MARTVVWAPTPLAELDGATGFVECDEALAAELLTADEVQDPRIGGNLLRHIEDGAPRKALRRSKPAPEPAPPSEPAAPGLTTITTKPRGKVTK